MQLAKKIQVTPDEGKKDLVLIVDDELGIRKFVGHMLTKNGYDCHLAGGIEKARQLLEEKSVDLVLCDVNLSNESGIDFLGEITSHYPETAVIMVTGMDDPKLADAALKAGAFDFIAKPIERNRLLVSVSNALRRLELERNQRRHRFNLEQQVADQTASLRDSLRRQRKILEGMVYTIATIIEIRDPYTAGHQRSVANLAAEMARRMNFSTRQIEGVRLAGLIHDVGKMAVPAEILSKPGRLDEVEYALIQRHAQTGFEILKDIEFRWPVANMVHQHHERMDGSGYPQGLVGSAIEPGARILAVADVVEAMASHRPYRPALGLKIAFQEIQAHKGVMYDAEAVEACIDLFDHSDYKLGGASHPAK